MNLVDRIFTLFRDAKPEDILTGKCLPDDDPAWGLGDRPTAPPPSGRPPVRRLLREEARAFAPHCDSSILHAPGTCEYCDQCPDWQELRRRWRINFTGENDPDKAPCPATHFRPLETINRWGGNVPKVTTDLDRKADTLLGNLVTYNGKVVGRMVYFDGKDAVLWSDAKGDAVAVIPVKDLELAATAGEEHDN